MNAYLKKATGEVIKIEGLAANADLQAVKNQYFDSTIVSEDEYNAYTAGQTSTEKVTFKIPFLVISRTLGGQGIDEDMILLVDDAVRLGSKGRIEASTQMFYISVYKSLYESLPAELKTKASAYLL